MTPPNSLTPASGAAPSRPWLTLDLRSLALLRVGLALWLMVDALCRSSSAALLYSDAGLLPRASALPLLDTLQLSLHLANGSATFATLLCLLQAGAALALLLGCSTRSATLLSLLLAVSAAARNPLLPTLAEGYACALLLWGLFVPWHARWSVDAALSEATRPVAPGHRSIAAGLLLLQVLWLPLWLAAGAGGWSAELATLLAPEQLGRRLAALLLQAPALYAPLASLAHGLLWLIPLMALLPPRWPWMPRLALAAMVTLSLLGALLLQAGALAWLALCGAALLIDSGLWQRALGTRPDDGELRIYLDRATPAAHRMASLLREFLGLTRARVIAVHDSPRAERLMSAGRWLVVIDRDDTAHLDGEGLRLLLARAPLLRGLAPRLLASQALADGLARAWLRLRPGVAPHLAGEAAPARRFSPGPRAQLAVAGLGVVLLLGLLTQAPALRLPLRITGLDLLAPPPGAAVGWLAIPGETLGGREVDVLGPAAATADLIQPREALFGGLRGRVWRQRLAQPAALPAQRALADYLCARPAATPQDALLRLRLVLLSRTDEGRIEQRVLLRHDCAAGS